jgi:hypothetical protein
LIRRWLLAAQFALLFCVSSQSQSIAVAPMREYFQFARDISIAQTAKQNYVVVDTAIWAHSSSELLDIRLYAGDVQVPYALSEEQGASSTLEHEERILNLGVRGDRTEFDVDIGGEREYNRVELQIKATNFVASAAAEGSETDAPSARRKLSTSTLYDFSREGLGNNFALRIPPSTFRFLHVTITPAINPRDITGASTSQQRDVKATWISAGNCKAAEQSGRTTRIGCDLDPGVPVARILFTIPTNLVNYRRNVSVSDAKGTQLCSGSISRIRMKSGHEEVIAEDLALPYCANKEAHVLIEIDNGDNKPLAVEKAEPQALERRIYFDPGGKSAVRLYYGDEKLSAPEYDYARFFHRETDAVPVIMGVESRNPEFTGRPDERPWSERHGWVLWGAMLAAVAVLAVLAVKGLTGATPQQK